MNNIGALLKDSRLKKRLSQKQAGSLMGYLNGQYLSNIERGTCPAPLPMLKQLSKIYAISPARIKKAYMLDESEKFDTAMED